MNIGIISDIHGNIDAFKNILKYLDKNVEQIYFLGDAVGYLPHGIEVLQLLKDREIQCIKGNHEIMLFESWIAKNEDVYQLEIIKKNISTELLNYVNNWKKEILLEFNNQKYLLVHGSPNNIDEYIYPDTDLEKFENINYDIVLMGHTHYPFLKSVYNKYFVNVGSVGLPRDVGNLSSFCIINTIKSTIEIMRLPFDKLKIIAQNNIHQKVVDCLNREKTTFFGEIIAL